MVNLLRKHQQTLMVLITVVVIITFVWFWNGSQTGRMERSGTDTVATIYGHHVSETEVQREARKFYVALEIGLIDLVQDLSGFNRQQAVENFIWNSMVLRREADRLQISVSDNEVKAELTSLRPLQTDGQFDPNKLNELVQRSLTPRGFTDTVIDDLVRDDLRLKKLKALVGSSVDLSPAEFRSDYDQEHQKMDVSVIRLDLKNFVTATQISDEDAKKAFEQRKDQLKSEEKRKVKVASFTLSDAEKKLTGKERNAALEKLVNNATEFTQALLDKNANFDEVSKNAKFHASVSTTGDFAQNSPDPQFADTPALTDAAFQLSKDDPNSDVVQGENGFYVLHLEGIVPSQPLTFEQAKPQIVEQLKQQRAKESLNLKASEVRGKIEADLNAGKSFAEAASATDQKVEKLPPFSLAEPSKDETEDQQQILQKAVELGEKQLSEPAPTENGSLLVYLEKRELVDDSAFAKDKATLEPLFVRQKTESAFREWMRTRRDAAKIQMVAQR